MTKVIYFLNCHIITLVIPIEIAADIKNNIFYFRLLSLFSNFLINEDGYSLIDFSTS